MRKWPFGQAGGSRPAGIFAGKGCDAVARFTRQTPDQHEHPARDTRRIPGGHVAFPHIKPGSIDYRATSNSEPGYRHSPKTTLFTTERYDA